MKLVEKYFPNKKLSELSLDEKMFIVQAETDMITKTGQSYSFSYASSSDVLIKVKDLLNKLFIRLSVTKKDEVITHFNSGNKKPIVHLHAKYEFKFINVHNPKEVEVVEWTGQGIGDETATGKADTYAEKYMLLKQFHIPTDDLDPEYVSPENVQTGNRNYTTQYINIKQFNPNQQYNQQHQVQPVPNNSQQYQQYYQQYFQQQPQQYNQQPQQVQPQQVQPQQVQQAQQPQQEQQPQQVNKQQKHPMYEALRNKLNGMVSLGYIAKDLIEHIQRETGINVSNVYQLSQDQVQTVLNFINNTWGEI